MISKKILKLISAALASVMFVNSFGTLTRATSYDRNAKAAIASTKKDTNKSKIRWILGGCGSGAGALALVSYLLYRNTTKTTYVYIESDSPAVHLNNELSKNQPINVTADDWFNRLGGTQKDIDDYNKTLKPGYTDSFNSLYHNTRSKYRQIALDTNRYSQEIAPNVRDQTNGFKEAFTRLLVIYYTNHTDISYTQGWGEPMYMIYRKFRLERDTNGQPLGEDDEAKVYFIYTKFMKMLAKFNNANQWDSLAQGYHDKYIKISGNGIDNIIEKYASSDEDVESATISNIFLNGIFAAGFRVLGCNESIRVWDHIIMDDVFVNPSGDFNADTVLDNLNVIIYQHFKTPADIEALFSSKKK